LYSKKLIGGFDLLQASSFPVMSTAISLLTAPTIQTLHKIKRGSEGVLAQSPTHASIQVPLINSSAGSCINSNTSHLTWTHGVGTQQSDDILYCEYDDAHGLDGVEKIKWDRVAIPWRKRADAWR
jgi:hypothetical protein